MSLHPITAFILAGGRSTRMGRDKALLHLAGRPLIEHAVAKLQRLCAQVRILTANPALAQFAPTSPDLHPGCGPIGGIHAALAATTTEWNLILPVDMPFLPLAFLSDWIASTARHPIRAAIFTVDGIPHPTLALLHRDLAPSLAASIAAGAYKLRPALEAAAAAVETNHLPPGSTFQNTPIQDPKATLWFTNLNHPEDLTAANSHLDALVL